MATLELPHSPGCLVCGRDNPHGLHLSSFVDTEANTVHARFQPAEHHIGFRGIVHGGVVATVVDEVMTWAATWVGKRFCVCGELTVRFRSNVSVRQALTVTSLIEYSRPRLIQTAAKVTDEAGTLIAFAQGKYVPMDIDRHLEMVGTLVVEPATADALAALKGT